MANFIVNHKTLTPTATADTTDLVDSTYPFALQGASGSRNMIKEVYGGGQAPSTSSPIILLFARDSQIATGALTKNTLLTEAILDFSGNVASTATSFNIAATLKPRRSSSLMLMNLSFNAFGGIVRWVPKDGTEPTVVGNTASGGEASLSAFTGGTPGLAGFHMIYESL